jgi:hypothetical protein
LFGYAQGRVFPLAPLVEGEVGSQPNNRKFVKCRGKFFPSRHVKMLQRKIWQPQKSRKRKKGREKFLFHEASSQLFMIFWFDLQRCRSPSFFGRRFSSRKTILCAFNSIKIQFPHVGKFTESIMEVSLCVEEILWREKEIFLGGNWRGSGKVFKGKTLATSIKGCLE